MPALLLLLLLLLMVLLKSLPTPLPSMLLLLCCCCCCLSVYWGPPPPLLMPCRTTKRLLEPTWSRHSSCVSSCSHCWQRRQQHRHHQPSNSPLAAHPALLGGLKPLFPPPQEPGQAAMPQSSSFHLLLEVHWRAGQAACMPLVRLESTNWRRAWGVNGPSWASG
jgi:hypothetical protein